MVLAVSKRLLAFWILVCFAAGSSCHLLCASQTTACPLCESQSHDCCKEEAPCKTCQDSQKLTSAAQPSKPLDLEHGLAPLIALHDEGQFFSAPGRTTTGILLTLAEDPPVLLLLQLTRSFPIRAPTLS